MRHVAAIDELRSLEPLAPDKFDIAKQVGVLSLTASARLGLASVAVISHPQARSLDVNPYTFGERSAAQATR